MSTTLTNPVAQTAASARVPSRFGFATHLACRECGHTCVLGSTHACDQCFGPLEVAYDLPPLTRESIESGPLSMWRYASLLPVRPDVASIPNLDPGWTRLVRADQLANVLGMRELWIKDERGNPTHSFKDRVVGVALAAAIELGFKVLACPSTGNLAERSGGRGSASRHPLRRTDPRGPRAAEDRRLRRLRRLAGGCAGQL